VHLHALLRLDGYDPDRPEAILPPPVAVTPEGSTMPLYTVADLHRAVTDAIGAAAIRTPAHPARSDGWRLIWGPQAKVVTVATGVPDAELTERHVAGYLAKYATKATEAVGFTSGRLDADSIAAYADPARHTHRLISACWELGADPEWIGLRKWAHMLGFGGHFHTKSRRYSTTMTALREARRPTNRIRVTATGPDAPTDDLDALGEETTLVINTWQHVGNGWRTIGDAALAAMAADAARQRRPHGITPPAN